MKSRVNKLKTVNLENQDAVKEELDALEEKYYEAERRCQDYETKVWHLQQERNLKSNDAPPTDHDVEADYADPNDFPDGPYRGDDEEEEEEEDVPPESSASSESEPEPPVLVLSNNKKKSSASEVDSSQT